MSQTPREILLGRHRAAESKLDAIRLGALSTIAEAQAQVGYVTEALQTVAAMTDRRNMRFAALRSIAAAQARAGDVSGALQSATAIMDGVTQISALKDIAAAQARAGDANGALGWITNYKKGPASDVLAQITGDTLPRVKAYALVGVAEGMLDRLEAEEAENP